MTPRRLVPSAALLLGAGLPAWGAPLASGPGLDLSRAETVEIVALASQSREDEPEVAEITGGWRLVATAGGVRTWEAPLPVRPRTLFFHRAPDDMALLHRSDPERDWEKARKVSHKRGLIGNADEAPSWEFTTRALRVRRAAEDGPPEPHEYAVHYTKAVERERELQRKHFDGTDQEFVQRSLQLDDTTRRGLLLPAPSTVAFEVEIPRDAVLDLGALILPPELADPTHRSDGARLEIKVIGESKQQTVLTRTLSTGHLGHSRVSLAEWGGQSVRIELSTDPRDTPDYDYVFVTEPAIFVPDPDPPKVALVFIDTLRPDHMSIYGYGRETTPRLEKWTEDAAVYEAARSIAPWTLPSARTMTSGVQPERWKLVDNVQELLGEQGWATGFFAGNVYLSSNFEMSRGWGTHRCTNWPLAQVQVDRALEFMDAHQDQPTFVLLHLMDMHLPYTEPPQYRWTFAGSTPEVLGDDDFLKGDVDRAARKLGEEGKQYIRDRYDNNLRYVDDQVARFLAEFDEDDLVLIVSDHGEEFWDHGDFEHGHSLYEELLRVPMVVRGPGVSPGRVASPTSLLDLAPTIAKATGHDPSPYEGVPLQDLDATERPLAFGRPLYGSARWGVVTGDLKYRTAKGKEHVNDLAADPAETDELAGSPEADLPAMRGAMAEGLGRDVKMGYRVMPSRTNKKLTACLEVPGGVAWAYAAEDPTFRNEAEVTVRGDQVKIVWDKGNRSRLEVFVVPEADTAPTDLRVVVGDPEQPMKRPGDTSIGTWKNADGSGIDLGFGVSPAPLEEGAAVGGFDSELSAELQALGYVEEDAPLPQEREEQEGDELDEGEALCIFPDDSEPASDAGALPSRPASPDGAE